MTDVVFQSSAVAALLIFTDSLATPPAQSECTYKATCQFNSLQLQQKL
jgi:hypothetical protein